VCHVEWEHSLTAADCHHVSRAVIIHHQQSLAVHHRMIVFVKLAIAAVAANMVNVSRVLKEHSGTRRWSPQVPLIA
jgi:hypothetical protein